MSDRPDRAPSNSEAAIWHDVECGAYAADFKVWDELADRCGDPILELGAGTGRLVIHLARRGHRVFGLDYDEELIAAQAERAAGLPVTPLLADARDFDLPEPVALVLAPMQLLQMLPDRIARLACLESIAAGLLPGGRVAAAMVEGMPEPEEGEETARSSPTSARSTAGSTRACRWKRWSARSTSSSTGCARRSRRAAS